jgi:hypothetical protein
MPDIKKYIKYKKEQEQIFKNLFNILNTDEIILYDIDTNKEKQQQIYNLIDNIKRYYPSSGISGINKKKCKRPYLSIIKYLMKLNNYNIITTDFSIYVSKEYSIRTKKYKFIKEIID